MCSSCYFYREGSQWWMAFESAWLTAVSAPWCHLEANTSRCNGCDKQTHKDVTCTAHHKVPIRIRTTSFRCARENPNRWTLKLPRLALWLALVIQQFSCNVTPWHPLWSIDEPRWSLTTLTRQTRRSKTARLRRNKRVRFGYRGLRRGRWPSGFNPGPTDLLGSRWRFHVASWN